MKGLLIGLALSALGLLLYVGNAQAQTCNGQQLPLYATQIGAYTYAQAQTYQGCVDEESSSYGQSSSMSRAEVSHPHTYHEGFPWQKTVTRRSFANAEASISGLGLSVSSSRGADDASAGTTATYETYAKSELSVVTQNEGDEVTFSFTFCSDSDFHYGTWTQGISSYSVALIDHAGAYWTNFSTGYLNPVNHVFTKGDCSSADLIVTARNKKVIIQPDLTTWIGPFNGVNAQDVISSSGWSRASLSVSVSSIDAQGNDNLESCASTSTDLVGCDIDSLPQSDDDAARSGSDENSSAPSDDFGPNANAVDGQQVCESTDNPINFAYGFKHKSQTDYSDSGLSFTRFYRSDNDRISAVMGERWWHNFDRVLSVENVNGTDTATLIDARGAQIVFEQSGSNWTPTYSDIYSRFENMSGGGYLYTTPRDVREYYDTAFKLVRIEYRGNEAVDLSYDAQGRLTSVTNEQGKSLSFAYNGLYIDRLTTPTGIFTYSHDANGNLTDVTKPDSETITYHYEHPSFAHALTGITDESGERAEKYVYDWEGRPVSSSLADGTGSNHIIYDTDSTTVINALGKQTTYHFQTINDVRKIVEVEGHQSNNCAAGNQYYTYDAYGNMVSKTDWQGNVTAYGFNSDGLVTSTTYAQGTAEERTVSYTHDATHRQPDVITESGKTTDYDYDLEGRVTSITVKDTNSGKSRTTTYSYHPDTTNSNGDTMLGRLASVDGARTDVSDVTTYTYDAQNRLIKTTNALGHYIETLSFDAANRPLMTRDANGIETHFVYDMLGRVISSTVVHGIALAATTGYTYDENGNVLTVTQPNEAVTTYTYDAQNRLTKITDALDHTINYLYDAAGNITLESYQDGVNTRYFNSRLYDELSRVIESANGDTEPSEYAYDLNNNQTGVTDGNDNATSYAFDGLNRLVQESDALSGVTSYALNDLDQNEGTTDPRTNTTSYTYNAFGDVLTEVSPDRGTTTYTYDKAGNMLTRTDARGEVVTYTYDALNRILTTSFASAPSLNQSFTYDSVNGCGTSKGRLCSVSDARGTTSYIYDELGRLTDVTETRGNLSFTTSYTYDLAGTLTGITYPSGRVITHGLNANAQVSSISEGATILASNITYLPFGGIESMTYGNGVSLTNSYNTAYQLTNKQHGSLFNRNYTYDAAGNITAIGTDSYTYDALYRLTSKNSDSYTYDAIGNRLTDPLNSYVYPITSSRLSSINSNSITTDAAGYITADSTRHYTFNAAGQLAHIGLAPSYTASYTYNANNQRTSKTTSAETIHYVYGLGGLLYGEYDESGHVIREYVYLNGEPLAQFDFVPEDSVIIDNGDSAHISKLGTWPKSSLSGYYGSDSYWNHTLGNVFNWKPELSISDTYEVFGWWPAHSNRDPSATFEVHHTAGVTIVQVDQTDFDLAGQWNSLGSFSLDSSSFVRLVTDTQGVVVSADAVRFLRRAANETLTYLHTDHLGTPRIASDENATSVWSWDGDAFGIGTPTGTATINLRFPGQYYDHESGLHYNWNRYYNPETGRYISSDPIGLNGGLNTFAYLSANPVMFVDPEGLAGKRMSVGPQEGAKPPPNICPEPCTWHREESNSRGGRWIGADGRSSSWDDKDSHWDTDDGKGNRQRYDRWGNALTPEQAHNSPRKHGPIRTLNRSLGTVGIICEILNLRSLSEDVKSVIKDGEDPKCVIFGLCDPNHI